MFPYIVNNPIYPCARPVQKSCMNQTEPLTKPICMVKNWTIYHSSIAERVFHLTVEEPNRFTLHCGELPETHLARLSTSTHFLNPSHYNSGWASQ